MYISSQFSTSYQYSFASPKRSNKYVRPLESIETDLRRTQNLLEEEEKKLAELKAQYKRGEIPELTLSNQQQLVKNLTRTERGYIKEKNEHPQHITLSKRLWRLLG